VKKIKILFIPHSHKEKLKPCPIKCICLIAASPSLWPLETLADRGLFWDIFSVLSKAIKKTLQFSMQVLQLAIPQ
jgi:hypothetical protein